MKGSIQASALKDAISAADRLVDEARLNVEKDRVQIAYADDADAAMVDINILDKAFEEFEAEEEIRVGIETDKLKKIVNTIPSSNIAELELSTDRLSISSPPLEYDLAVRDESSLKKVPKIPELDFGAEFVINGSKLGKDVKACSLVDEAMTVKATEDSVHIHCESGTDKLEITHDEEDELDYMDNAVNCSSTFSLDYLDSMTSPMKNTPVTVEIGDDIPIVTTFELVEGLKVEYLLAPRIEA